MFNQYIRVVLCLLVVLTGVSHADNTSVQQSQQQNIYNTTDNRSIVEGDHSYRVTDESIKTNSHNYSVWQQNTSTQTTNQVDTHINQEGVIGNGNTISSGTNANGGDIKTDSSASSASAAAGGTANSSATSGASESISTSGASSATSGGSSINYNAGSSSYTYRQAVQAPNLGALVGYISQNDDMCRFSNGGSASGSNGMGAGGLSLLFGVSDGHCEMLKKVKFLMAGNDFVGACTLILLYDRKHDDGLFAQAMEQTGGCIKFRPIPVTVVQQPTALAANTLQRLNSLKSPNTLIDQAFNQGMLK